MAEEKTTKKGQLAAAVLAGSALAFSSFAIGLPAAWAAEEDTPTTVATASEEEGTPEAPPEDPETSASETTTSDSDDSKPGDLGEEVEPTEQVTEEETSTEPSAEPSPDEPSLRQPQVDDDGGDDGDDVNEELENGDAALEELRFEVSPRSGPSGTQIHVSGSGFSPEGKIEIEIVSSDDPDSEAINFETFDADVDGELNDVMLVPGLSGLYHVTATDVDTGRSEVDTFNITDVTMDIDPDSLSDEEFRDSGVTLTLEELEPNQIVDVAIGNRYNPIDELSGDATANGDGVATFDIKGAEDLRDIYVGAYSVIVNESGSDVQLAEGSFEVTSENPRVGASAQNPTDDGAVRQGEILYVTGYNATPDDFVTIDYGIDGISEEVETDEDGQFGTEFKVPEDAALGVKTLTLTDDETGAEASTQYTVAEAAAEGPQIDLNSAEVYQGGSLDVEIWNLSVEGKVKISWNPTETRTADANGELNTSLAIADTAETGTQTLTVTDLTTEESASVEYTVLAVVDPSLSIDPERIELDDFIGEPEDGAGVTHIVEGLEPGTEIAYAIAGPENVNDFENTATAGDDGVASFVIHGYDVANPAVYLGEYNTVVTFIDEEDETVTLSGSFTVIDGDDSTGGTADSNDGDGTGGSTGPVDVSGSSGLAQTGATGVQIGFLAGGLLLLAGAGLVAFANRQRLFGRTA